MDEMTDPSRRHIENYEDRTPCNSSSWLIPPQNERANNSLDSYRFAIPIGISRPDKNAP